MTNKTILIIDDDPPTLHALRDKFKSKGFNVLTANDGVSGLGAAMKNHPDIILLDIIMPRMDGMTMLKKLREDEWGKKAEVIMLTNLSDNDKIEEAAQAGTYDYLIKTNWGIEDVVKKVKEKLGM